MSILGFGDMMKQMTKLQAKMDEMKRKLEALEVEGESGGGMVKVIMNGRNDVLAITIEPGIVSADNVVMLQDLIKSALEQARAKAQEAQAEALSEITGGIPIPGLSLPF